MMRTIRVLADENIARQKVERLRALNLDVVSVAELGLAGLRVPDATVLRLAREQERVVLTHNDKDFKRLHASDLSHTGILILPNDARHTLLAEATAQALETKTDWTGCIARVHRPPPDHE